MSCHIVPQFQSLSEDLWEKGPKADLLDDAHSFYLNEYASHMMYAYMRDWKKI
jgi:hypothetical protein